MATLDETQTNILAMVLEGKTNRQIAKALNYSISNVKYHLEKIYKFYKISHKEPQNRRALLIKEVTRIELTKLM